MATNTCTIELKKGISSKNNLKRNNYFKGKALTAEDFTAEQNYVMNKIRNLSAKTNGFGVIEGLTIASINQKRNLILNAGAAIDNSGNLLLLNRQKTFKLEKDIQKDDYIYLKYIERGVDDVSLQDNEECNDECCYNKIEEAFEVVISADILTEPVNTVCVLSLKLYENAKYLRRGLNTFKTSWYKMRRPLNQIKTNNESLVLIGQYTNSGGFDYTHVNHLYKNSELSQLLCHISNKYVSSINGHTGDVAAVTSINNATPNENGELNLVAGNNITLQSENSNITISSKNGFYHDYYISLDANQSYTITHNAHRFPSVDVYRRNDKSNMYYQVIKDSELKIMARDTNQAYSDVKANMEALSLDEHLGRINKEPVASDSNYASDAAVAYATTAIAGTNSSGINNKTMYDSNPVKNEKFRARDAVVSNKTLSEELSNVGVTEYSAQALKLSNQMAARVIDQIYIAPIYTYTKIVGSEYLEMNIEVTQLNRNKLILKNKASSFVSLLVVLNT